MAGFKHGVYTGEQATGLLAPVETNAALPVYFGTAPVHLASEPAAANRPILCYGMDEAVAAFGYSEDWSKYTLCEAMFAHFQVYNRCPIVLVNVLDPATHKTAVPQTEKSIGNDGTVVLNDPVILSTLVVKKTSSGDALVDGTDYSVAYNDDEECVISVLEGGALDGEVKMFVNYDKLNASAVTSSDIIGGIDSTTGKAKGLEVLEDVFPLTRMVPGNVLAPGWSETPAVAAVMKAKASLINETFVAEAICDIPTGTVKKYTDVPTWKNSNNYASEWQIVGWPMGKVGDYKLHMSTVYMGTMMVTDSNNDDVPSVSPSNKDANLTGICLADGTEVVLDLGKANYLNGNGIVTAYNFVNGWTAWGNCTGCYPGNTDPKDFFIPIRRMFNWMRNNFILTFWQKVDDPTNKRLIHTVVDTYNIMLNGLTAAGKILGGRIEFNDAENPATSLIGGKLKFHIHQAPPPPAQEISAVFEYDPSYLNTLFS